MLGLAHYIVKPNTYLDRLKSAGCSPWLLRTFCKLHLSAHAQYKYAKIQISVRMPSDVRKPKSQFVCGSLRSPIIALKSMWLPILIPINEPEIMSESTVSCLFCLLLYKPATGIPFESFYRFGSGAGDIELPVSEAIPNRFHVSRISQRKLWPGWRVKKKKNH